MGGARSHVLVPKQIKSLVFVTAAGDEWTGQGFAKRPGETNMMKFLSLGLVLSTATFSSACFSFSSTTRSAPPPAPAPAPPPGMQRTVYPDGSYVDRPIEPVPR